MQAVPPDPALVRAAWAGRSFGWMTWWSAHLELPVRSRRRHDAPLTTKYRIIVIGASPIGSLSADRE